MKSRKRLALILVYGALLASCATGPKPSEETVGQELSRMYHADQDERLAIMNNRGGWNPTLPEIAALQKADRDRRARVYELQAKGSIRAPEDKYFAAMILQHGSGPKDYEQAHEFAKSSAADGYRPARWLAAATLDRWLMSQKRPQKYGTQFINKGDGWILYDVDPSVTDEERSQWDCPSLEKARQQLDELHRSR